MDALDNADRGSADRLVPVAHAAEAIFENKGREDKRQQGGQFSLKFYTSPLSRRSCRKASLCWNTAPSSEEAPDWRSLGVFSKRTLRSAHRWHRLAHSVGPSLFTFSDTKASLSCEWVM
jgi:hypothetical protein